MTIFLYSWRIFNKRFSREPTEKEDAHRPLAKGTDLQRIFARKTIRKLSKELSFSYEGVIYHLETQSPNRIRKTHVQIISRPNKPLIVELDGKPMKYTRWEEAAYKRAPILDNKQIDTLWRSYPTKPSRRHPWR